MLAGNTGGKKESKTVDQERERAEQIKGDGESERERGSEGGSEL